MSKRRISVVLVGLAVPLAAFAVIVTMASNDFTSLPPQPEPQWPMFHATPDHRGWTPATAPVQGELAWTYNLTEDGTPRGSASPVVFGDYLYLAAEGGTMIPEVDSLRLAGLTLGQGTEVWRHDFAKDFAVPSPVVTVHENRLFVGLGRDSAILATGTGEVQRTVNGSNAFGVTPTNTAVYIGGSYFGEASLLRAYDPTSFETEWSIGLDSWIIGSPSVASGLVIAVTDRGTLYAVQADSGHIAWSNPTGIATETTPAVADGRVILGFEDGTVRSFELSSGEPQWSYQTAAAVQSSPAISASAVFVGSSDGRLLALRASDGTLLWNYPTGGPVRSSPASAANAVVFGSDDTFVYALQPSDGQVLWKYQTGGPVRGSPAVVEGYVFVGADDGLAYAFHDPPGPSRTATRPLTNDGTVEWFALVAEVAVAAVGIPVIRLRGRLEE